MSIPVSNVLNTQTMGTWFNRQNVLSGLMSSNVVTADQTNGGSITVGNVAISGAMSISNLVAFTIGGGSSLTSLTNLSIISNTSFSANIIIVNTALVSGNIQFSNSINVNNFISANTANIGGAINTNQSNLTATSSFGNNQMTQNVITSSSNTGSSFVGNTNSGNVIIGTTLSGIGIVGISNSSYGIAAYSNTNSALYAYSNTGTTVKIVSNNGIGISIGNGTDTYISAANIGVQFSNLIYFTGSTSGGATPSTTTLNSNTLNIGNSVVNTVVNSSSIIVGSNTTLGTNSLKLGNNVINTVSILYGNSVVSGIGANLSVTNTTYMTVSNSLMVANTITIGTASVNTVINATSFTGTSANATLFNNHPEAYYANVTNPIFTSNVTIGAIIASVANGINANNSYFTIGNSSSFSTVNSTIFSQTSNNANNFNGQPASFYANVTSPIITSNVTIGAVLGSVANGINANNSYITIGNSSVNTVINATSFTGTSANATLFNNQSASFYANVTSPVFSTTVNVGTTVSISTTNVSIGITGTSANSVTANASYITIGNSSVNTTINSTFHNTTSNNALYLNGVIASGYQGTANLAAAVALITSNSSSYIGTLAAASVANNSTPTISTSLTVGASSVVNTTCVSVSGNVYGNQLIISGNGTISGNLTVTGNLIYAGSGTASANFIPASNALYSLGNSSTYFSNTYTVYLWANGISFNGGGSVNAASYTGTAANATLFNNQPASFYANATQFNGNVSPQLLTVSGNGSIGGNLSVTGLLSISNNISLSGNVIPTSNITFNVGNSTLWYNNIYALSHSANVINFVGGGTVNNSNYTGTSFNANNLNGQLPSYYANTTLFVGNVNPPVANITLLNTSGSTFANGISSSLGSFYGQFIAVQGSSGVIFRNDGTNFNFLANTTNPYSSLVATYRPFSFNLTTGAVSIDSTGIGTTFGGDVTGSGRGKFTSLNHNGVEGYTETYNGVQGTSNNGVGVVGFANNGWGLYGQSTNGTALLANSIGSANIIVFSNSTSTTLFQGSNGNLGIGTSTPNTNLTVNGSIYANTIMLVSAFSQNPIMANVSYSGPAMISLFNSNTIYSPSVSAGLMLGTPNVNSSIKVFDMGSGSGSTVTNYNNMSNTQWSFQGASNPVMNLSNTGYLSVANGVTIGANTFVVNNSVLQFGGISNYLQMTSTTLSGVGTYNVIANNSTYLNGQPASYYANTTSYTGAFNGTTVICTGAAINGLVNITGGAWSNGFYSGLGQYVLNYGGAPQTILRQDSSNFLILMSNNTTTWSNNRPFYCDLYTGAVTLDNPVGTTLPAGVTMGGKLTIGGSIQTNQSNLTSTSSFGSINMNQDSVSSYSNNSSAFVGRANSGIGINGTSNSGSGVYGSSNTGSGIQGLSTLGWGIYGYSSLNLGIYGASNTSTGVFGYSNSGIGIFGQSNSNVGVYGQSLYNGIGVQALSNTGWGAYIQSKTGPVAWFGNNTTQFVAIDSSGNINGSNGLSISGSGSFGSIVGATKFATPTGTLGSISVGQSDSTHTGILEIFSPSGTRAGYIGWATASDWINLTTENGYLGYKVNNALNVGGTLNVTGATTVGSLTASSISSSSGLSITGNETISGNITAGGYVQAPLMNVNAITANYTVVNSDLGKIILVNNGASNVTITVNSCTQYGRLMITRTGSGTVTIVAGTATLNSRTGGFNIVNQYGSVSLFFTTTTTAIVDGNI